MRSWAGVLLLSFASCEALESPPLDAGPGTFDAGEGFGEEDAGPAPSCRALELDLPVTLLGRGASHVPLALVHPPAGTNESVELIDSRRLVVVVSGPEVVWRTDRFIAVSPGRTAVRVELGDCRVDSSMEVLGHSSFATELVDLELGRGSGHGADSLPQVVLGPPVGAGPFAGSLDVLSLGIAGSITLGFGDLELYDGPGPDFIVFENAFRVGGGAGVFAEPGEVSIFTPERQELRFPCDPSYPHDGCAGLGPVLANPSNDRAPTDPNEAGGDAFDLEPLAPLATRVRIRDVGTATSGSNSGFDLDAIAAIHVWPSTVREISAAEQDLALSVGDCRLLPGISAQTTDGLRIEGVASHVAADVPDIVTIENHVLCAVGPGRARITFRAGPYETSATIEVSSP